MCNRYVTPTARAIEQHFELKRQRHALATALHGVSVYPRSIGLFLRPAPDGERELVAGQWALVPAFAKSASLPYSTNNARFEELARKPSFKQAWAQGQRCIVPVASFDEPCWETGRNVWWTFRRADGAPFGLAGLWNTWTHPDTGERVESYTLLTQNADACPLMARMHKPDPKLPADQQDKRSVVVLAPSQWDTWLHGARQYASACVGLVPPDTFAVEVPPSESLF